MAASAIDTALMGGKMRKEAMERRQSPKRCAVLYRHSGVRRMPQCRTQVLSAFVSCVLLLSIYGSLRVKVTFDIGHLSDNLNLLMVKEKFISSRIIHRQSYHILLHAVDTRSASTRE